MLFKYKCINWESNLNILGNIFMQYKIIITIIDIG